MRQLTQRPAFARSRSRFCGIAVCFSAKVNKVTLLRVLWVQSFAQLVRMGGANMRMWIRVLWTALVLIAIAWPLLFWGKAASLDRGEAIRQLYNPLERHELLW